MGWRTDWLYKLVFAEVRGVWRDADRFAASGTTPTEVQLPLDALLICEYANADFARSSCLSPLMRQWVFDGKEFWEVVAEDGEAAEERRRQQKRERLHQSRLASQPSGALYPQGTVCFTIAPDRKRIVFLYVLGPLYGRAFCWRVQGQGRNGKFVGNPDAVGWIS